MSIAAPMGRRRASNPYHLPPRLHWSDGSFYYVGGKPRVWTLLSADRAEALVKWAAIEGAAKPPEADTFGAAWAKYKRVVLPTKAQRTQIDNLKEAKNLLAVFEPTPLDDITPQDWRRYLDIRGEQAKTRANREKALFSHVFNMSREWGMTKAANPCAGVKGHRETGRDRYVEDDEYAAVWSKACAPLQDAMDLLLLTAQRPSDVLKMLRPSQKEAEIWTRQGKTKKRLRIVIEGRLAEVVKRCTERAASHAVASLYLLNNEAGQRYTASMMRDDFDAARKAAKVTFQLRDLRGKTATDLEDLALAQKLLGHSNRTMTEHYVKQRASDKVRPLR